MTFRSRSLVYAAIACLGLVSVGCQQQAASNTSSTTTTTEASNTTAPTGEATNASSTTTTTTASTANLPASCQSYLSAVQACIDHLGNGNPAVAAQIRQSMETTRQSWAAISDQAALGQACTTAQTAFTQSSHAMGC